MKYVRCLMVIPLALLALLGSGRLAAQPWIYQEGAQYQRIDPPQRVRPDTPDDRIEVTEMFLYACPHCYRLDPKLEAWAKTRPEVVFRRVPAIIGPTWAEQARAYYLAEALGILDKAHPALFRSIHEQGKQYLNEFMVTQFLVSQGADPKKLREIYYSQPIIDRLNHARELSVHYGLRGVPAVVVNGKYVTAPYFVRGEDEMMRVLDFLVERERLSRESASEEQKKGEKS